MAQDSSSEDSLHSIEWEDSNPFFDYEDPYSISPQLIAVIQNDVERLKALLKGNKSPNVIDNHGNTPLHVAVMKDKEKAFDYLMTLECVRLDAVNYDGITPLMMAIVCGHQSYARQLILKGADVNIGRLSGDMPLHGVITNSSGLSRLLLEHGADIDCRNCVGKTPLYLACESGNCDSIHMLLYYGADVTICDEDGVSPLAQSFRKCPNEVHEILFNYTFGDGKIEVHLKTLVDALVVKSPLFYKIVEKTSTVIYTDDTFVVQCRTLYTRAEEFKLLIRKFPRFAKDFFDCCNPLVDFLHSCDSPRREIEKFFDCFYMICESPYIGTVIQGASYISLPFLTYEETAIKYMCTMLSYGWNLHSWVLNDVYQQTGYGGLFKMLLYMPISDYASDEPDLRGFFIPTVIYNVNVNFDDFLQIPEEDVDPWCLENVKKFFTTKSRNSVPSLLEMSREAARRGIINFYKVKNNVQFFTVMKRLPLINIYKEILTYEKPIYNN